MPTMLVRRGALLAKIEAVEGVGETPDPSTDGVLVENIRVTFNPTVTETMEVTPSLDPFDPIVGGMSAQIECDVYITGSGLPNIAPDYGDLLKICSFAETINSVAFPASPAVFAAGGTTGTVTLAPTASTVDHFYRGMPILIDQGASGPTTTVVANYSGASKGAGLTEALPTAALVAHTYQFQPNVRYELGSSSVSSGTIWVYNDGILYKFVGCRGTVAFTLTSGGPARAAFRFMGMFSSKIDAALPAVVYATTRPPIWKNGACMITRSPAAMQTLTLDIGGQLVTPDNPNSLEAFDPAIITARQPRGTMNPKETLVATRDVMSDFRNSTKKIIYARLGTTVGNRAGFTVPSGLYLNQTPGDRNGYRVLDVPFHMTGQDAGVALTLF